MGGMDFPRLIVIAQEVVAKVHRRLPPEVREAATIVPVCYEPQPNPVLLADGCEPDILGLFVGHEHGSELGSNDLPLPPQILLFLDNLWDYAEGDEAVFRDEVRLTYLHELGHYLGWDEDEIAARGLE
jgi:predicted Zn-dependent protease with MMP-like domain